MVDFAAEVERREPHGHGCLWERMPMPRRRFILVAVITGIGLIVAATVWLALDYLANGYTGDGILFLPLVLSLVIYAVLIGVSVLLVVRTAGADAEMQTQARLGSLWALASIPLMFDFLVDSFPGKLVVNVLFVIVGIRYWRGRRNSYLSLFLAPLTLLIAAADGVGHLQGAFCSGSALDACPAKAVSDFYLVMLLIGVTAVTLGGRTERPDPRKLALATLVIVLILAGFALAPF